MLPPLRELEIITEVVSRNYRISPELIRGKSRLGEIVDARHVVIFLALGIGRTKVFAVSRYLGRDHSTIGTAYRKMSKLYATNPEIKGLLDELLTACKLRFSEDELVYS